MTMARKAQLMKLYKPTWRGLTEGIPKSAPDFVVLEARMTGMKYGKMKGKDETVSVRRLARRLRLMPIRSPVWRVNSPTVNMATIE